MKKWLSVFIPFILICYNSLAQETFKPSGSGTGTLFFNYHNFSPKSSDKPAGFELERAYLGYKYDFSKNIKGRIVFDVAYDTTVKAFSAFAKNALIEWQFSPRFRLTAGMIGLKQFDTQEKFWAYRYVMKSFSDEYKLGASADLGVNLEFSVNKFLILNAFILNGEGYKSLQDDDGMQKFGGSIIAQPIDGITLKIYGDYMPGKDTSAISEFCFFAGYEKKESFRIGAEYNFLQNGKEYKKYAEDYSLGGFSVFGAWSFTTDFELFGRYDLLTSNKLSGGAEAWNFDKDRSLLLLGIQYRPAKGVNISTNFRHWMYRNSEIDPLNGLFLNIGLNF